MKHQVLFAFIVVSSAAPDLYGPPKPPGGSGYPSGGPMCKQGQVMHVDGSCVVPEISQTVFVYDAPERPEQSGGSPPYIPPPKIERSILFVNLPEQGAGQEPIILPPPKQESIVYVLNKGKGGDEQKVIEVTTPKSSYPEVYFVNYEEGDNPLLPIGVDLQTALKAAAEARVQSAAGGGGARTGGLIQGGGGSGGNGGKSGGGGGGGGYRPPSNAAATPSTSYRAP
ncbi:armadillo repeat-containing X-linked protein 2-like [Penaeus japonicus]|uniref:armadillo repeat-containing X-linked protein 2-like n=1 Tax=Penaeus japonicus TaxID=27405 RepID=UPI001C716E3F|nr:armadillo repeat-containing X-linked protein 2-like [Penaeus japonicus]